MRTPYPCIDVSNNFEILPFSVGSKLVFAYILQFTHLKISFYTNFSETMYFYGNKIVYQTNFNSSSQPFTDRPKNAYIFTPIVYNRATMQQRRLSTLLGTETLSRQ